MLSFEEWMVSRTPDGQTNREEVYILFSKIERVLGNFINQIDRRALFLDISYRIYEQSA